MHDAKGQQLKKGDIVIVPFEIKDLYGSEDYCNVNLESLAGMQPEGHKTNLGAINTKMMIRANEGDDTSFKVVKDEKCDRIE